MRTLTAVATAIAVVLLLRSTLLAGLAVRGVVLDALAFATVAWGLMRGAAWGSGFGFALGLAADLDAAHWLGRHALALSLVGYVVGRLSGTLVRDSVRTQFVLVALATAAHQTWSAAFELGGLSTWPLLLRRVVISGLATGVIGAAILMIARRLGGRALFGHADLQPGKTI
jgi:rod shape-determining protein MreD